MVSNDDSTRDGILRSLADTRRRCILTHLLTIEEEAVSFEALVDEVVAEETNSPPPDRSLVAASLHHHHLPKLADAGLINVTSEQGSITTTDRTELVEPYLPVDQRETDTTGTDESV
jgi:hypothetical protein